MPDLDDAALERRLRGVLKEHLEALPLDLTVDDLDRRRQANGVARRSSRGRSMTLLAAAALLLVGGALAAGSGLLRLPTVVPPVPEPSVVAVATASPDATSPSPSMLASPTPVPSATPAPITWTPASLNEDWPGLVRSEPDGRPIGVPILWKSVVTGTCPDCSYTDTYGHLVDPTGDAGSDDLPWADIKDVTFCGICVKIEFVSHPPERVDPAQQWFAYGVVVDTDGDGVADWRYGTDNEPVATPGARGSSPRRWWRTDLHTGRTESTVAVALWEGGHGPFWGNHGSQSGDSGLSFGGDFTRVGRRGAVPERFYAWASVIQDGRVVATDYAPDAGWLVPSADAKK